jgi:hypothetical protein
MQSSSATNGPLTPKMAGNVSDSRAMARLTSRRLCAFAATAIVAGVLLSCSDHGSDTAHRSTTTTPSSSSTTSTPARTAADTIGPTHCTFPSGFYNSMRVDSLPVLPQSPAYVAGLGAESNWPKDPKKPRLLRPMADDEQADFADGERQQQGIPVNYLAPGFPTADVQPSPGGVGAAAFEARRNAGEVVKLSAPGHSVAGTYPAINTLRYQGYPQGPRYDAFAIAVAPDCTTYEMSGLNESANDPGLLDPPYGVFGAMAWNPDFRQTPAQTGRRKDGGSSRPLGATASYVPLIAGLVRLDEVQPGRSIDHVIHMFTNGCTNATIWPARASDCGSRPGLAPYGTVFRLRADFDPAAHGITDPVALKLVDALKTHGAMVLSTGGDTSISMESAPCRQKVIPALTTATCWGRDSLDDFDKIPLDQLQAVDTSAYGACHPKQYTDADDWWKLCPTTS